MLYTALANIVPMSVICDCFHFNDCGKYVRIRYTDILLYL